MPSFEELVGQATVAGRRLATVLRGWPGMLIALAGVALLWTRMLSLEQGMWRAEISSVSLYIRPGPHAIFGHFSPSDQPLFGLLAWLSSAISGSHDAAVYRFWTVAPAIAAGTLMVAWLWRRLDRSVAAVFAILAVTSPLYLELGSEAQGYGLGFLSVVLMLIGADGFARRSSHGSLVLLATGALVGIWTLPVIVLPFLGVAAVTLVHRRLRRPVLATIAAVAVASMVFYAPVLGEVLTSSGQWVGTPLSWHAPLTGPVRDLLAPNVSLLLPNFAVGLDWVIAAAFLAAGFLLLWRAGERLFALLLVAPAFFTYVGLTLGRFDVMAHFSRPAQLALLDLGDRSTSFLVLPLLACVAVGLVGLGRLLARASVPRSWVAEVEAPQLRDTVLGVRPLLIPTVACAVILAALALGKIDRLARRDAALPLESYAQVGAVVTGTEIKQILTNATDAADLRYYIGGDRKITTLSPPALEAMFCRSETGFIYIEVSRPAVDVACLEQRRAVTVRVPERTGWPIAVRILRGAPQAAIARQAAGE